MDLIGRVLGRLALLAGGALLLYIAVVVVTGTLAAVSRESARPPGAAADIQNSKNNRALFLKGRQIFRFDTFGDEAFWGGQLQLHRAIAGEIAEDTRYDLHALIELVERGCPPGLAVRILASLEDEPVVA